MSFRAIAVVSALAVSASLLAQGPTAAAQQNGAPYSDVTSGAYYTTAVAALAEDGVFAGTLCDDGFCPGDAIDRKTMAVWVVRLLDGQEPPAVAQTTFADVEADSFYAPFIERMAELDVTRGCGDGSGFCPDRTVSRAQMAAFLSRAYGLADGPDPGFTDVAGDAWYAADVARLAASGITRGCGDGTRFCPGRTTTRAEMATFLHRAENPGEAEEAEQPSETSVQLNSAMDGGGIISRGPCVVKTDGTITCWNTVGVPETDNPSGTFTAVSGRCAIRTDATITCWGGYPEAPSGTFAAVSAGGSSCAIRTDATLTCWGHEILGLGDDPSGTFTAVSVGGGGMCAIRTGGTIACWGSKWFGFMDAPSGTFTALSVGGKHSCAISTDGTVTCWGDDTQWWEGQAATPSGTFTAVSSSPGSGQSCGIRTDATIACWGQNYLGQADAPSGTFIAVSAGNKHSCAVRTDGTITCWGEAYIPPGQTVHANDAEDRPGGYAAAAAHGNEIISAGSFHSCGLLADRSVACWGDHLHGTQQFAAFQFLGMVGGETREFSGLEFLAVSAGRQHSCGLLADQTVTCSGHNYYRQSSAPLDRLFLSVSAGDHHSCGVVADQTVTCWGNDEHGQSSPPAGRFSAVSAGAGHSCGLRADQTLTCWGGNQQRQSSPPAGQFSAVSAGNHHSCGLRANQTLTCWGGNQQRQSDAPAGQFSAVSAGNHHSCGLRANQTLTCWGGNQQRQSDAPAGQFSAVSAGNHHSCGLRANQTLTCWGNNYAGERDSPMLRFLNEPHTPASAYVLLPRTVECQQQAVSEGKPGPPSGVQIVRINLISGGGLLLQPATVGWTGPCSGGSVDHYVVQWRRGYEGFGGDSQHIVRSADTTEAYSLEIPDLRAFAVRVTAVNRDGQSQSAEVMVPTPANEVRALLEEVVVTFEDRYPWLSEVEARMNRSDFAAVDRFCGPNIAGCAQSDWISIEGIRHRSIRWDEDDEQEAHRSGRILDTLRRGATAVHEMAHVYHDLTDLAINPPAIAAGWMYLNEFLKDSDIVQGGDCRTQELYADIPGILMAIDGLSKWTGAGYWSECRSQEGKGRRWPSDDNRWQELLDVMRSVYVHQEVPQWFYDTYQRADSSWDVDAIKETLGFYTETTGTFAGIYWQLRQLIPDL